MTSTTRTADISMANDAYILVKIKPEITQTLQDAKTNVDSCLDISEGRRMPIMVDITQAVPLDSEVRSYYNGKRVDDHFSAIALIIPTGNFGVMLGNIYFRLAKPQIPKKLFTNQNDAIMWLAGLEF